ncbi:MAG TPA: hypothetical protein PK858_03900, partial [Saprospiraceae bacterium]|nr:hypothetical protein [Saprospiraceae bacterium]
PSEPVKPYVPIIELGKYSVLRNGKPYTGKMGAQYRKYNGVKTIAIYGSLFTYNGLVEEIVDISDNPLREGQYRIDPSITINSLGDGTPDASITWHIDVDQYGGSQLVDTSRTDHYMEIIRYDSVQHTVEGKFQVFFRQAAGEPLIVPGLPDTISFTQGIFHLKISN